MDTALAFCQHLVEGPALLITPGRRDLFTALFRDIKGRWWPMLTSRLWPSSMGANFARFPALRWRHTLAAR
jgi:hypothetical protein